jgi:hypothetical protein
MNKYRAFETIYTIICTVAVCLLIAVVKNSYDNSLTKAYNEGIDHALKYSDSQIIEARLFRGVMPKLQPTQVK